MYFKTKIKIMLSPSKALFGNTKITRNYPVLKNKYALSIYFVIGQLFK